LDIADSGSKISLIEEENSKNEVNTQYQLDLDFTSKSQFTLDIALIDKRAPILNMLRNSTFNVYLNPTVPPPRIS